MLIAAVLCAAAAQPLDYIEKIFGATNVNAVAGHGALTAGFAADGDLTVLSWPSPGLADQLGYLTSNDPDARSLPHFGAHDGMGSYIGLQIGTRRFWLRDLPHTQGYSQPDAPVPITTYTGDGFTVTVTDVITPDADTLTRHVHVTGTLDGPVALLVYENLNPTLSHIPEVPIGDWALDGHNDFFAVWDESAKAILHVHPGDQEQFLAFVDLINLGADVDFGAVETLMGQTTPTGIEAFVAGLDTMYSPGVVGLVTTSPAPTQHQVGADATPLCGALGSILDNVLALPQRFPGINVPISMQTAALLRCTDQLPRIADKHGWRWRPQDALADLSDGELSGSSVAAAQTNGALITPLVVDGGAADGDVIFAFGATVAAARAELAKAAAQPFAARQAAAEKAAHDALAGAPLPDAALGARVRAVALRALVNLYVARDRATGAFLAAITRQPPYELDWPRDGAFLSLTADLMGRGDWVTQRDGWYASLIRTSATPGSPLLNPDVTTDPDTGAMEFPAGGWEMNYYVDGAEAGPIRFEIDNGALHVWSTAVHAATLGAADRKAFLDSIWPSDRAALDLLVRWKEKDTDLPAPANEDDNLALTSTLHGAVAVHAALVAGARLAHAAGDDAAGRRYLARARALAAAIDSFYWDPAAGRFRAARGLAGGPLDTIAGWDTGWLIWPGRVLGASDPRVEAQLSADMTGILAILRGETVGGTYTAKNVVAAALYGKPGGARDQAREAVGLLAGIATPDTDAFGEVYLSDGKGGWSNRTATPHVWEGALFYLAAMALTDPTMFNQDEQLPLPPDGNAGGGGCGVAGRGAPIGSMLLAFAAVLAGRVRSRSDRGRGRSRRSAAARP
jgi:hypothetical protein